MQPEPGLDCWAEGGGGTDKPQKTGMQREKEWWDRAVGGGERGQGN